jgi:hypothetical protein
LFFTNPWIVFGDPKQKSNLFVAYLIEEWGILEEDEEDDDGDDDE